MKQVLIRQGRIVVEEMRAPSCGAREVLVETAYSLISAGTETATVRDSEPKSAGSRLKNRASKIGEVVRMARHRGLEETRAAVGARLEGPSIPTGYSLSGTVREVGTEIDDIVPGQRVACAGASSAHHAEIVAVPRNLVVAVPNGLPLEQAACVTLGAIALQGVRQTDARLGEIVCVMGLGLVGQLTVALLSASGCRVIGTDIDPGRLARARECGLELGILALDGEALEQQIDNRTGGRGVDAAVLTAATPSSELIRQAVRVLRQRGRVVVVGDVGLALDRGPFFAKEAELRISCSYGPGRYDPSYEERGIDYPYGYVRWTENRNMQEFLRLAAERTIPLEKLLDRVFPIHEANQAYAALTPADRSRAPLGVLLQYPGSAYIGKSEVPRQIQVIPRTRPETGLGVALIGPGCFARAVHLPHLAALAPAASLRAVVGRTANATREVARRYAAAYASTDLDEILGDDQVELVLICTRHDQHVAQAVQALQSGKAVFCEKPAAIDLPGLLRLDEAVRASKRPFMLGFNRRFAPDVLALRALLADRCGPLVLRYRVNAGKLARDHWALGPEGGGRLIGEACHMIDLAGHLVGHPRTTHSMQVLAPPSGRDDLPLGDNFTLGCRYADGSLSTITYTSLGHAAAGKESVELHWDGRSAVIDDFRSLQLYGAAAAGSSREQPDKGHREMLRRFVEHAAGRGPEPIPWEETLDVSRFVLDLDREVRRLTG